MFIKIAGIFYVGSITKLSTKDNNYDNLDLIDDSNLGSSKKVNKLEQSYSPIKVPMNLIIFTNKNNLLYKRVCNKENTKYKKK